MSAISVAVLAWYARFNTQPPNAIENNRPPSISNTLRYAISLTVVSSSPPQPHPQLSPSMKNARARMFGLKNSQTAPDPVLDSELMNVAGRYGRFKISDSSKVGKEGEPFVDAPVELQVIKVPTKYDSGFRLKCTEWLNHPLTEIFMIILTIIALYITDSNQVREREERRGEEEERRRRRRN